MAADDGVHIVGSMTSDVCMSGSIHHQHVDPRVAGFRVMKSGSLSRSMV